MNPLLLRVKELEEFFHFESKEGGVVQNISLLFRYRCATITTFQIQMVFGHSLDLCFDETHSRIVRTRFDFVPQPYRRPFLRHNSNRACACSPPPRQTGNRRYIGDNCCTYSRWTSWCLRPWTCWTRRPGTVGTESSRAAAGRTVAASFGGPLRSTTKGHTRYARARFPTGIRSRYGYKYRKRVHAGGRCGPAGSRERGNAIRNSRRYGRRTANVTQTTSDHKHAALVHDWRGRPVDARRLRPRGHVGRRPYDTTIPTRRHSSHATRGHAKISNTYQPRRRDFFGFFTPPTRRLRVSRVQSPLITKARRFGRPIKQPTEYKYKLIIKML